MATDPSTAKHYNANAEGYHQHVSNPNDSPFHAYYEKPAIRAALPPLNGLEVLSVGCGSGVDTRWLAENGAQRVVGIDIAEGLIDIARRENPTLEFKVMDMEKLDFPDESFDLLYSSLAIHYVDDWIPALKEAYRVLRSGGSYIFSCGHPIDSAVQYDIEGDYKYVRLGRRVNQVTKERVIYGDYLVAGSSGVKPLETAPIGGAGSAIFYHRPISKMVEEIVASGFTVEQMIEPQPTAEYRDINPQLFEQLSKIPSFMIWGLRKA